MAKVFGFILGVVEVIVGIAIDVVTEGTGGNQFIVLGIATIAGSAISLLTGRPHQILNNESSVKANVRGTTLAHTVCFGKVRVGGIVVKVGTYKQAGDDGANNLLIALAHSITHPGGCDGIERVWIDDREIPLASLNQSTTSGVQTTTPNTGPNLGNLTITTHLGDSAQAADSTLLAQGLATSTDYARGICYSVFNLYRDKSNPDGFNQAYSNHVPALTVELRGQKCYDPRQDSTAGGSGTQRVATPTTWAWSDNPAICASTFMVMAITDGGEGIPVTEIDWSSVAAAANICDQSFIGPAGSQKRFRVSAGLSTADRRNDNLSKLLDAMFGTRVRVGAKYRIYAGAYANPTDTIDETWLAGPVMVTAKTELTQLYNAVRVTYADEKQAYKNIEGAPFINSTFETQDGGDRLFRSVSYPTCPDVYQAQVLGTIAGNKSRRQMQVTLRLNWRGLTLDPWQTVSINLSAMPQLTGRTFRVTSWQWTSSGPIIGLSEDGSSDYTVSSFTNATGAIVTTTTTYSTPERVTGVVAIPIADGVRINWTESNTQVLKKYVYRSPAGAGTFAIVGTVYSTGYTDAFVNGANYDYKIVVISDYGVASADSAIVNGSGKTVANGATVGAQLGVNLMNAANTAVVSNQDGIPDGGTYGRTNLDVLTGNRPDLSKPLVNRSLDYVADTGSYARISTTYTNANRPITNFADTFHLNKNADNIADGGTYGRPLLTSLTSGQIDLSKAGVINRSLDYISDSGAYARTRLRYLQNGRVRSQAGGKNLIANPNFELNTLGQVVGNYSRTVGTVISDGWEVTSGDASNIGSFPTDVPAVALDSIGSSGSRALQLAVQSGTTISVNSNNYHAIGCQSDYCYVKAGERFVLTWQSNIDPTYATTTGLAFICRVLIAFYDTADASIAGSYVYFDLNTVDPSTAFIARTLNGTVPAGAAYARVFVASFVENTTGTTITPSAYTIVFRVDDFKLVQPVGMDSEVSDGTTYGRTVQTALTSGQPDMSKAGFINRTLDNIADTASFARTMASQLSAGVHKLTISGSGVRLGSQSNYPQIATSTPRSTFNGAISYTSVAASSGSATTGTVNVAAGTLLAGSLSVSYNSASVGVSGVAGTASTFYLYWDDAGYGGGSQTLVASTNPDNVFGSDARVYIGKVVVNFATGGGSGGGSGGGGCVWVEAYDAQGRRFKDVYEGYVLDLADEATLAPDRGEVLRIHTEPQPCQTITAANGAALTCSDTAPIPVQGRGCIVASALSLGDRIATVTDGQAGWSEIVSIVPRGVLPVRPLSVGNRCFWAGDSFGLFILHHNKLLP